ncbi:MAG: TatD family hydrolase [Chitinophagaceae bacterium]
MLKKEYPIWELWIIPSKTLWNMLTDTHAHLYLKEFDSEREAIMERALGAGVQKIYLPNIDSGHIEDLISLEKAYPDHCFAMMGLHPCYVHQNVESELLVMESWLKKRKFWAIGEIGLDFYWDQTYKEEQFLALRQQIDWAKQYQLPVVLHTRSATPECIREITQKQDGTLSGIFHCFSGSLEEAREIINLGFYLGIGGVVTFKNAGLDKIVEQIDLHHLVLETDAPYLAPVPYRGKQNEPAHLLLIAQKVAQLKGTDLATVTDITTQNAKKVFER